jgi:hypothetical protein
MARQRRKSVQAFLSYSSDDSLGAAEFYSHTVGLRQDKVVKIWMFEKQQRDGEWERQIKTQLDVCHILIVFLSPSFVESKQCKDELAYVEKRIAQGELVRIVVILYRDFVLPQKFRKLTFCPMKTQLKGLESPEKELALKNAVQFLHTTILEL